MSIKTLKICDQCGEVVREFQFVVGGGPGPVLMGEGDDICSVTCLKEYAEQL